VISRHGHALPFSGENFATRITTFLLYPPNPSPLTPNMVRNVLYFAQFTAVPPNICPESADLVGSCNPPFSLSDGSLKNLPLAPFFFAIDSFRLELILFPRLQPLSPDHSPFVKGSGYSTAPG